MGRKNKAKGTAVTAELDPEVAARVETKQKQGDTAAGLKNYQEALNAYDEALKELPDKHAAAARLHACKATVFVMEKKWKEAVKECNTGLEVDGGCIKALDRRSRARFEMGFYKDALSDIVKVNSSAEKTEASAAHEERVRNALHGSSGAGGSSANGALSTAAAGGGGGGKSLAAAAKPAPSKEATASLLKGTGQQFTCKVAMDGEGGLEIKYVHVAYGITYYALQKEIRTKWPNVVNFKIFYQDKDNEWVLVTCHKDVVRAQQEVLAYAHRAYTGRQRPSDGVPPAVRLRIEKCNRCDVPQPPKEEVPQAEQKSKVVVKSADPHAEETVIELDEWLLDFANLWRDAMGIDPDKHVDLQTEGTEKCTRALDTVVRLPEAQALLDEACDRFRDVTCMGLCNWANVHVSRAKKAMEHAAEAGRGCDEIRGEVEGCIAEAVKRYQEALSYSEKNVDALLGLGQVYLEEARFAARLLVPAVDGLDSEAYKEYDQSELEEMSRAQGRDANAKLKTALEKVAKEDVERSKPIWDKVYEQFRRAEAAAAAGKSARTEEREAGRAALVVSPPPPDETHLVQNQVKIIWGNALYDQSQIWAGMGLPGWKEIVEDAKARFLSATCKASDVDDALRNHICAGELDLPVAEKPGPAVDGGAEQGGVAAVGAGQAGGAAKEGGGKEGKGGKVSKEGPRGGLPALKAKKGKASK